MWKQVKKKKTKEDLPKPIRGMPLTNKKQSKKSKEKRQGVIILVKEKATSGSRKDVTVPSEPKTWRSETKIWVTEQWVRIIKFSGYSFKNDPKYDGRIGLLKEEREWPRIYIVELDPIEPNGKKEILSIPKQFTKEIAKEDVQKQKDTPHVAEKRRKKTADARG